MVKRLFRSLQRLGVGPVVLGDSPRPAYGPYAMTSDSPRVEAAVDAGMEDGMPAGLPAAAAPRVFGVAVTQAVGKVASGRLRVAEALRAGGAYHLLLWVLHKVSAPLGEFGCVAFFARELFGSVPDPDVSPGIAVSWASPDEIDRLVAGYDGARSAETLRERFRRQDRCIIGVDDRGQIVHCRWLATRRAYIPECDVDLVLGPREAYFYDGYTRRALRGRGIDGRIRSTIFQKLRADGFERVYSYVRGDNPVGLKAARRWQQPVTSLWYIRARGLRPLVIGKRTIGLSTFETAGIPPAAQAAASPGRD